jgi:antitoxin YefM
MDILTYSHLRQNLANVMDKVCRSRRPVIVSRQRNKPAVVVMSLEEFNAIEETLHLMRNPSNAARLLRSIANADVGNLRAHDLLSDK